MILEIFHNIDYNVVIEHHITNFFNIKNEIFIKNILKNSGIY